MTQQSRPLRKCPRADLVYKSYRVAISGILEPYVRRALLAVIDLHKPVEYETRQVQQIEDGSWQNLPTGEFGWHCGVETCNVPYGGPEDWPCPTVSAIMDAMHEPEGAHTHDEDGNAIPSDR